MISLGALLDPGFRHPASCLITLGEDQQDLGDLARLVMNVEITTSREQAAMGSITIEDRRKEDGQWMVADSGLLMRWQPIRIQADFKTYKEEVFRGYITIIKPGYPNNGGEAKLDISLQDESAALDRPHMRTVWGDQNNVNDLEIVTNLIKPLNLKITPGSGEGQSSRSQSHDTTPIGFIRERVRANGYELIFNQGQLYFGPMRLDGEPQAPIMLYAGSATNCLNLEITDDSQKPDAVSFDHASHEQGAEITVETVVPDIPVLGKSATANEGAGVGTPSVWRVSREGDETEEELRARAQALVNENSFKLRANGELDGSLYGHVLKVGRTVTIDGAGKRYGGLYYVDQVVHQFNEEGYRQQFQLIRNGTGESDVATGPLSAFNSGIAGLFRGFI